MAGEKIVIVGGGGHAKVCIEVLRDAGRYEPFACVDAGTDVRAVIGVPIVGDDDQLPELFKAGCRYAFLAIGSNRIRSRVAAVVQNIGFVLPPAIHSSATVSSTAMIDPGVLVMPKVVVNAEAHIKQLAILNTGAIVEHDCVVGVAAHVGPGSILTGNVHIGDRTFLGAGTIVRPSTRVAADVVAGSGAVIVSDIDSPSTVVGIPARPSQRRTLAADVTIEPRP